MTDVDVKEVVFNFLRLKGKIPGNSEEEQLVYPYLDKKLIDSLGLVEMVVALEEKFGIHLEPEHMQSREFRTIGGLIALVERLIEEKGNA